VKRVARAIDVRTKRMLSEYEMYTHLAKKGFISSYLLWHQHGEM
jgi:hypothetical protein